MKNIRVFTGLAATAVACAAMTLTSSAVVFTRKGNAEYAPKTYTVSLEGVDKSKIDQIKAEVKADSGYAKGCIRYQDTDGEWTSKTKELKEDSGEWTFERLEGLVGGDVQIELWWVNPTFDAQGNPTIDGVATIERVSLLDAEGNELKAVTEDTQPVVTEPPVTQPPVTEPPATQPPATQPPQPATEAVTVTQPPATDPPVTTTKPPQAVGYGISGNAIAQGINAANQIINEAAGAFGLITTTSETGTDVSGGTTESAQAVGYSGTETTAAASAVTPTGNVTTGDAGVAIAAAGLAAASLTAFIARRKFREKD